MGFVWAEELLLEVLSETGIPLDGQQDEPRRWQPKAIRQLWSHCRTVAEAACNSVGLCQSLQRDMLPYSAMVWKEVSLIADSLTFQHSTWIPWVFPAAFSLPVGGVLSIITTHFSRLLYTNDCVASPGVPDFPIAILHSLLTIPTAVPHHTLPCSRLASFQTWLMPAPSAGKQEPRAGSLHKDTSQHK